MTPRARRSLIAPSLALSATLALSASLAFASTPAPSLAPAIDAALASFAQVFRVLQSPRCINCHPAGDAPLRGDAGTRHWMNVSRRSAESGLPCTTCHQSRNGVAPRSPPGVPDWHMPSASMPMVFQGKTPRELCEQLKDPSRNGGKSLDALREHFAHDPLVLWGWNPGPGRSLPPIPHEELVAHVARWIQAGAPCPP